MSLFLGALYLYTSKGWYARKPKHAATMLNAQIDTLATQVYAIRHDLSYSRFSSTEVALTQRPAPILIVIKSNAGRTESFYNNDFFAHSNYQFLQPQTNETYFAEKGWTLVTFFEPAGRSRTCEISIADPLNVVKKMSNLELDSSWPKFFQIDGLCNTLRLIKHLATYSSWAHLEEAEGNYLTALKRVNLTQPYFDPQVRRKERMNYIWKLSSFLTENQRRMSLVDLRNHLVRNDLRVTYTADEFKKRKVEQLVREVESWLNEELNLYSEANKVVWAFMI